MLGPPATSLTITNPLVKYRALLATKAITPDNAQFRLAVHLQKLYERLKDYEPQVEYSHRLEQISRAVGSASSTPRRRSGDAFSHSDSDSRSSGVDEASGFTIRNTWRSLLQKKEQRDSLALTRRLTSHEAAKQLTSPRGLMVHGEVGTGKSMLIDLFADCLPNRKKRRWHFNTFMLETISKLETFRVNRARDEWTSRPGTVEQTGEDYSLLWLAREMIQTSPVLFLDEFQMPDRVASKILINLMTSFFHLGGVLIATSNRMPEELAQASGVQFSAPPPTSKFTSWTRGLGLARAAQSGSSVGGGAGLYYAQNEFVAFLDVLKARCEVWEMENRTDYRRVESGRRSPAAVTANVDAATSESAYGEWRSDGHDDLQHEQGMAGWPEDAEAENNETPSDVDQPEAETPTYYHVSNLESDEASGRNYAAVIRELTGANGTEDIHFVPEMLSVYGRQVAVPRTCKGVSEWTFAELCKSTLGPADYITIASTHHTLILRDIPVLTWLMKNEARRFITLLDALYECRCKLYINNAAAGPDDIFFPDQENKDENDDSVYSETISEVYQDATAPFRPNVLTQNPEYAEPDYTHAQLAGSLRADSLEDQAPAAISRKSVDGKTDRSSDPFGRSYGLVGPQMERGPIDPDDTRRGLDFSKTSAFTGEDEMFAYRRAQSRLWELCGRRWWARSEPDWHRPLPREVRRWEGVESGLATREAARIPLGRRPVNSDGTSDVRIGDAVVDETRNAQLFRHGSSPFRSANEPPPSFNWTHAWGMMKWGQKAGRWGKGVDGLGEHKKGQQDEK